MVGVAGRLATTIRLRDPTAAAILAVHPNATTSWASPAARQRGSQELRKMVPPPLVFINVIAEPLKAAWSPHMRKRQYSQTLRRNAVRYGNHAKSAKSNRTPRPKRCPLSPRLKRDFIMAETPKAILSAVPQPQKGIAALSVFVSSQKPDGIRAYQPAP